ncbi:MAG: type II secretion system protein J [Bacilli bacterium]
MIRKKNGFTLVETVAAMVILSIVILGSYQLFATVFLQNNKNEEYTVNYFVTLGVSNYIKSLNYNDIYNFVTNSSLKFNYENCIFFSDENHVNMCKKVFEPIVGNYTYDHNNLYVLFIIPTIDNYESIKNEVKKYPINVVTAFNSFNYSNDFSNFIYYIVYSSSLNEEKVIEGILTNEIE